jgi:hypothetical protein
MTEETKNDPARKMRTLLAGGKTSPVARLPKKNARVVSSLPKQDEEKKDAPDLKKITNQTLFKAASSPAAEPASKGLKFNFGPPFWTIASVLSLTVNVILFVALLVLLPNMKRFDAGNVLGLGNKLLGGLYTNFEKMDRAHITTTIPVETTIPVKFDLQLNQQTNVVLSQDVRIDNAVVTVKTGGLNITNALTTIILPQGTILPIVLNLTVPVDTTVPVVLNVNVDIPMDQTQLHEPFAGLQDVIKPFYCMVNPNAVNLDGQLVCK